METVLLSDGEEKEANVRQIFTWSSVAICLPKLLPLIITLLKRALDGENRMRNMLPTEVQHLFAEHL